MVPTPAGTVAVAVALPAASIGVLWTFTSCPAAVTRTVTTVPCGILVVARAIVTFPAAVKVTSGVLVLPLGDAGTTWPATLVMRMSAGFADSPVVSGGPDVGGTLKVRLDVSK